MIWKLLQYHHKLQPVSAVGTTWLDYKLTEPHLFFSRRNLFKDNNTLGGPFYMDSIHLESELWWIYLPWAEPLMLWERRLTRFVPLFTVGTTNGGATHWPTSRSAAATASVLGKLYCSCPCGVLRFTLGFSSSSVLDVIFLDFYICFALFSCIGKPLLFERFASWFCFLFFLTQAHLFKFYVLLLRLYTCCIVDVVVFVTRAFVVCFLEREIWFWMFFLLVCLL